jgi:hypothetical protein
MPSQLHPRPQANHQPHQLLLPFDLDDDGKEAHLNDASPIVLPTDVWRTLSPSMQAQVFRGFGQVIKTLLRGGECSC